MSSLSRAQPPEAPTTPPSAAAAAASASASQSSSATTARATLSVWAVLEPVSDAARSALDPLDPVFELTANRTAYHVGRSQANDLVLRSAKISAHHATLRRVTEEDWLDQPGVAKKAKRAVARLEDRSRNGTFVNGKKMINSRRYLVNGDEIVFGPLQEPLLAGSAAPSDSSPNASQPQQFRFRIRAGPGSSSLAAVMAANQTRGEGAQAPSPPPAAAAASALNERRPGSVKIEDKDVAETAVAVVAATPAPTPTPTPTLSLALNGGNGGAAGSSDGVTAESTSASTGMEPAPAPGQDKNGTTSEPPQLTKVLPPLQGSAALLLNHGGTEPVDPVSMAQASTSLAPPVAGGSSHAPSELPTLTELVRRVAGFSDPELDAAYGRFSTSRMAREAAAAPCGPKSTAAAETYRDLSVAFHREFAARGRPIPSGDGARGAVTGAVPAAIAAGSADVETADGGPIGGSHAAPTGTAGQSSSDPAPESESPRAAHDVDQQDPDTTVEVPRSSSAAAVLLPDGPGPFEASVRPVKRARTSSVGSVQVDEVVQLASSSTTLLSATAVPAAAAAATTTESTAAADSWWSSFSAALRDPTTTGGSPSPASTPVSVSGGHVAVQAGAASPPAPYSAPFATTTTTTSSYAASPHSATLTSMTAGSLAAGPGFGYANGNDADPFAGSSSSKSTMIMTSTGPVRKWVTWSAFEDNRLLEWCDARVPRAEVATRLGRTVQACSARVAELRKRRRLSQAALAGATAGHLDSPWSASQSPGPLAAAQSRALPPPALPSPQQQEQGGGGMNWGGESRASSMTTSPTVTKQEVLVSLQQQQQQQQSPPVVDLQDLIDRAMAATVRRLKAEQLVVSTGNAGAAVGGSVAPTPPVPVPIPVPVYQHGGQPGGTGDGEVPSCGWWSEEFERCRTKFQRAFPPPSRA
ncbi:hypothetical protein JCM3774_005833 [Rhodotorula dairenensis]